MLWYGCCMQDPLFRSSHGQYSMRLAGNMQENKSSNTTFPIRVMLRGLVKASHCATMLGANTWIGICGEGHA